MEFISSSSLLLQNYFLDCNSLQLLINCCLKLGHKKALSHQLLFRFLANGHLSWVSCQSCRSAGDKGDNEVIQEAMHRSPGIYLMAVENPRELSQWLSDEGCAIRHWVCYLQIISVESHSTSGREKEKKRNQTFENLKLTCL